MATSRTKAVVALGILDLARQAAHAWSAREDARRDRAALGTGIRRDARRLASGARDRLPARLEFGLPPWRRTPTLRERARTWTPVAVIVALASVAVVVASRVVARRQPGDADAATTDSKVVGAVRAGSKAIDRGVEQVVDDASVATVGTAAGVAAGSAAVKQAAVAKAKDELDERVVSPVKRKAITYGTLGFAGLTAWVVIVAVLVYLVLALVT